MATGSDNQAGLTSRWINLMLMLTFSLASLWLADLAFRAYERHFLMPQYPAIDADLPVNLAQLSYNEGVIARETAEGEFRVLSFGDSFTYSIMQPELSYNGLVQQQLNALQDEVKVSVVNLGEPGTGPHSFRAAHQYWSQIFQHQAVLFHIFLGNDVQDDAYLQSPLVWEPNIAVLQATNAYLDAGSKRVPSKFPLRMLDYAWAAWLSHKTTAAAQLPPGYNWAALTELDQDSFSETYFRFLDVADPQKLPALKPGYQQVRLLMQQAQAIAASGIKVAIVLGPSEPLVNDNLRAEVWKSAGADPESYELGLAVRLISALQRQVAPDVPLLDLTTAFRDRHQSSGEKLYFRNNTHWDQAGNALAADQISGFLAGHWFGIESNNNPGPAAGLPGPQLLDEAGLDLYLQSLAETAGTNLPQVSGAGRALQMFDGITGDASNWAMAELGHSIEFSWDSPQDISHLRLYLHAAGGRNYGLLLEALVAGQWQVIADRRDDPVAGLLDIKLQQLSVQKLRLTGTSNNDQAANPDNHFIHIEELEWAE